MKQAVYSIVYRPLLAASGARYGARYFGVLTGIPRELGIHREFALVGEVPVEGVPVGVWCVPEKVTWVSFVGG